MFVLLFFAITSVVSVVGRTTITFNSSTPIVLKISNDAIYNVGSEIQPMGDPVGGGGVPH